jgi:RNA polymerase sigma factor (sigma-70 family)
MHEKSDVQLLREYAEQANEAAFREIVNRHAGLVYSSALRQVTSPDLARDVAQSVFTDLARKATSLAGTLTENSSLLGWLYRSTRFTALNQLRDDRRRLARERQVMHIDPASEIAPDWDQVQPVLDEAMADLSDEDRDALLLRFFKNHDFRAIGTTLGVSDDAAQKRVSCAPERLRTHLTNRGVTTTAVALSAVLSVNAVPVAPAGLAAALSTNALAGTTLANIAIATTIKTIAMTTLQKTLIAAALTAAIGTGIYEAHQVARLQNQIQTFQQQQAPLGELLQQVRRERDDATNRMAGMVAENSLLKSNPNQTELLKLRGDAAVFQNAANDPTEKAVRKMAAKVKLLQQLLEQKPDKKIPELAFLTEKVWADVAWNADLDTEDGIRVALSNLRGEAENIFLNEMMKAAIKKYLAANNDILPANLYELKSYFDAPVTDAMLGRYELLQTGKPDHAADLVKLGVYTDEDYDSFHVRTIKGASGGGFNRNQDAINDAAREFARVNNYQAPTNPSQIEPFLHKAIDAATIQKYLNQFVVDPPSSEEAVMAPVLSAYFNAHNGARPNQASDLLPYITTPEQQAAFQNLEKNSSSPK